MFTRKKPARCEAAPAHLRSGNEAERLARQHLETAGLTLIAKNYRSPFGEIDLVMQHREALVFVEVRLRRRSDFGAPAETVDTRKQAKLRATAEHYLQHTRAGSNKPCRFDIVAITSGSDTDSLVWLQNAF